MTLKQKAVAKKVVENGGIAISKAMIEAGYSPNTAKTPEKLTESKGWKELMDTLLPDEKLLERHAEGLDATKIHTSHTEPDREVIDYPTRAKYIELGYKVKNKLNPDIVQQFNIEGMGVEFIDASTTQSLAGSGSQGQSQI